MTTRNLVPLTVLALAVMVLIAATQPGLPVVLTQAQAHQQGLTPEWLAYHGYYNDCWGVWVKLPHRTVPCFTPYGPLN